MKGDTFSYFLFPLLLLILICGVSITKSQAAQPATPNDGKPTDYLPDSASILLLPTRVGTFDIGSVTDNFGSFPNSFAFCGMTHRKATELGFPLAPTDPTLDLRVECTPHPMRVIFTKENLQIGLPTSNSFNFAACQGLELCGTKSDLSSVNHGAGQVSLTHSNPLNPLNNDESLCPNNNQNYNLLLSNEMRCERPNKIPDLVAQQGNMQIAPRWKTSKDGLFEILRSFTYSGRGRRAEPAAIPRTNNFVKIPKPADMKANSVFKECTASCDVGQVVKFNMNPSGGWKTVIYLNGKTKGFKVCIDAESHDNDAVTPKCRSRFELFILPKNGLVIWPKTGRASVIELKSPKIQDTYQYAIEFGYGYTKDNGEISPEFYVANMFREVVLSDSDGWSRNQASKVAFFFENSDDLVAGAGIWSPQIESGKTYVKEADAANVKNLQVADKKAGIKVGDGKESMTNKFDDKPIPIPFTTTPAPSHLSSNIHAAVLLQSTDNSNPAIYTPGKWWVWGLFIGFIIGSIATVAIIGGIFYWLRRTVYGFWYRGMYKRYGCDASGTTGGITGVGFGNTTTGAITVGGNTTAGGATTGKTGMSTTGTTGGTTGSTTGGASTIAM